MNKKVLVFVALLTVVVLSGRTESRPAAQSARPLASTQQPHAAVAPATAAAATERALLDQYCVTCHNDKTKRANLSLEKLDLTTAGDHAELWEKVIRKLRAGVMPPPGMKRPSAERIRRTSGLAGSRNRP